jgi:hypothetical protein
VYRRELLRYRGHVTTLADTFTDLSVVPLIVIWPCVQVIDIGVGLLCYFLVSVQTSHSGTTHSVCLAVHPALRATPLSWVIYALIAADWGIPILIWIGCVLIFIVKSFEEEGYWRLLRLPTVAVSAGIVLGIDVMLTNIPIVQMYCSPRWSVTDSGDFLTVFHRGQSEQDAKGKWESIKHVLKKGYPEHAEHRFPLYGLNRIEVQRKESEGRFVFRFSYDVGPMESWTLRIGETDRAVFEDHLRSAIVTFAERARVKADIDWQTD